MRFVLTFSHLRFTIWIERRVDGQSPSGLFRVSVSLVGTPLVVDHDISDDAGKGYAAYRGPPIFYRRENGS
jgi:hypothetical protein